MLTIPHWNSGIHQAGIVIQILQLHKISVSCTLFLRCHLQVSHRKDKQKEIEKDLDSLLMDHSSPIEFLLI